MNTPNILVPFSQQNPDVSPLYHSLALADRIEARLFILLLCPVEGTRQRRSPVERAVREIIRRAREAGKFVSFHIAEGKRKEKLLHMIRTKRIGLVVIGSRDLPVDAMIRSLRPLIPAQIIRVQDKKKR